MKTMNKKSLGALLIGAAAITCEGQSFINLDFESANVSPLASGQFELVSPANAFPGWQVFLGPRSASTVTHNTFSVGSVSTSILGPTYGGPGAVIQGNFTAIVQAGILPEGGVGNASLAQVGQVPLSSQSLMFQVASLGGGVPNLNVFLGGQQLNLVNLQSTPNYTLFGAAVNGQAGQVAELRFTGVYSPSQPANPIFLDAIQFSPQGVPEPGTWALLALGGALLWGGVRRRRK